jgi:hypothetical protein
MAGHSIQMADGSAAFVDYADAEGEARVHGEMWCWEFSELCGPLWLKKNGEPRKCQCPTSKAVWAAFNAWLEKYHKAKQSTEGAK